MLLMLAAADVQLNSACYNVTTTYILYAVSKLLFKRSVTVPMSSITLHGALVLSKATAKNECLGFCQ